MSLESSGGDVYKRQELVKRLNIERVDYMKDLPCGVINVANDDNTVDNKHLPRDRIRVLVADDDYDDELITYLIVTKNTKGDWTINDGDKFYDLIIGSNPVNYCCGIMDKASLNGHYIIKDNCLLYTSRCV